MSNKDCSIRGRRRKRIRRIRTEEADDEEE
jgi:hypothetical protein